ncbi:amino acid ABC transporter permease [Candidatus Amarolinea aalborgensis]|jgi:polar amino acid transport system permease protein|uniref:amino acid ABC transporter permease n=1 Tax=Candidatus Amarolinea aalborgensis TaxID=2249329 RepID=UPI003BF97139
MSAIAPTPGPGPRLVDTRGRLAGIDRWWLLVLAVLAIIVFMIVAMAKPYAEIWNFVKDGISVTLRISVTSFFTILIVGMLGGLGRISGNRIVRGASSLYVEVVRGIPLLVWLLYIWFALPQVLQAVGGALTPLAPGVGAWLTGLRIDPFVAAVIGFTVCYGAYMTEIFRAGIESISKGQMEAARSLGMGYAQAMRYIVLPQAIRVILPPVGNEFVTLLKDSSLVSVLAVSDLTRRGREYVSRSFLSFETFTMIALIYLLMTLIFTRLARWLEQRLTIGH